MPTRRELLGAAAAGLLLRPGQAAGRALLVREVRPLSVRGINYYPALTPWSGMWTKTPDEVWAADCRQMAALGCNCLRTFLTLGGELVTAAGELTTACLAKLERLLSLAWEAGLRVILCLEPDARHQTPEVGVAWVRQLAAAHGDDGRILLWDLRNEPEADARWTAPMQAYLRWVGGALRAAGAQQLTTVGLTWRADRLASVGLPDVMQYHEYAPKAALQAAGVPRVRRTIGGLRRVGGERPLLIGEFGMSTARDPQHGAGPTWQDRLPPPPGTEAEQRWLYDLILSAAEQEQIAGVLPWCLHSYPTQERGFLTPSESMMGVLRHDGSLKPAAELLRDRYAAWAARQE
ncbi:MAG: cellulase family glycosylhydrolase [Fimbriimonadaceae bacterium]|nr:cellulase family glycosylhydrolase [Fimbriimonadaceae bacterium]